MSDAGLIARHGISLPLALSDDPAEAGVVRDANGWEVFTVNTEGSWPDATALAVAALLLGRINATAPRVLAEAAEFLASALDSVRALLAPIAEESEAAMGAFQIAEDALASLPGAAPVVDLANLATVEPATDQDVMALIIQALRWAAEDGTYEALSERARRHLSTVLLAPRDTLVEQLAGDADLWRSLHQGLERRVCPALAVAADPLWTASGRARPRTRNRHGVEIRDYAADVAILVEAAAGKSPTSSSQRSEP